MGYTLISETDQMALYIKDAEAERLAERLAVLRGVSKTEAVRQALFHELERTEGASSLVERGVAFVKALHARARTVESQSADKEFIDNLYDGS